MNKFPVCPIFIPANRLEWIDKTFDKGADAVIIDLEDSVPIDQKVETRTNLLSYIETKDFDEIVENNETLRLNSYLESWITNKILTELKSLIDLKNINEKNSELRALAYHLYENNGVVKREEVSNYLNKLNQDERKKLRRIGVKFGRYHIFLYKLFKPSSVSLRILLWKNFNQKF